MAQTIADAVYNAALDHVATATAMHLCEGAPTTFAEVLSNSLAGLAVDTTDFTNADGDTSGRKVTIGAQVGFSITRTGTMDHVAFIDSANAALLLVTTVNSTAAVSSGDSRNSSAFDLEFLDP